MRDSLDQLVEALVREGSRIGRFLRPGLSRDEVISRISQVGVNAHTDVVELFTWHDGIDYDRLTPADGIPALVTYFFFDPLSARLAELGEPHLNEIERVGGWSHHWFPVFIGNAGDLVVVSNDPADPGSVWYVMWEDQPMRKYDRLEQMFAEALEEIDNGDFDRDRGANPVPKGIGFWREHLD